MRNKIIWVFGPSAVGKETFIRAICADDEIKQVLGWCEKKIVMIDESINFIQQYENDPIGERRIEIMDRVVFENKNNVNTVILIKGQNIDIDNNLVYLLKERLDDVEYEIILLVGDITAIFERVKKKAWFKKEEDDVNLWTSHIVESVQMVEELKDIKKTKIDVTFGWRVIS